MTEVYKNAFQEVYIILNELEFSEYEKIPNDVIDAIENGRNVNYKFQLNDSIPLAQEKLLPETRAILFNLYRDYLANIETKEKIINKQAEDMKKIWQEKEKKYDSNVFGKTTVQSEEKNTNKTVSIIHNEENKLIENENSIFKRMLDFIRGLIKKYK